MRKFVATAAVVAAAAATAVLPATHAHAVSANTLTLCAQGSHADVIVQPATPSSVGPASFSIASGTCSDLNMGIVGPATQAFQVSLAQHGRTPCYGPSTANDGGNFGFCEQPFDHTTVKYQALPGGGMSANYDDSSVTVNLSATQGAEVDFVFSNQLH